MIVRDPTGEKLIEVDSKSFWKLKGDKSRKTIRYGLNYKRRIRLTRKSGVVK